MMTSRLALVPSVVAVLTASVHLSVTAIYIESFLAVQKGATEGSP
jgi:hypothetical protein